jgi:hypothetical protein
LEATRRSFNKDFLLALAADFKKHGAAAIEKVRKQQPAAYMKICSNEQIFGAEEQILGRDQSD